MSSGAGSRGSVSWECVADHVNTAQQRALGLHHTRYGAGRSLSTEGNPALSVCLRCHEGEGLSTWQSARRRGLGGWASCFTQPPPNTSSRSPGRGRSRHGPDAVGIFVGQSKKRLISRPCCWEGRRSPKR